MIIIYLLLFIIIMMIMIVMINYYHRIDCHLSFIILRNRMGIGKVPRYILVVRGATLSQKD